MIPTLTTIDEGTVEQWAPIFQASPLTWKLLTNGKNRGLLAIRLPRGPVFEQVKHGMLRDSQITLPMLDFPCFLTPEKTYKMYVVMMGVHNSHQFFGSGGKLINSLIREIENAAANGLFFSEIVTVAYTSQGINLCKNFGLEQIGHLGLPDSTPAAKIFYGTGDRIGRVGHLSKIPSLARAYIRTDFAKFDQFHKSQAYPLAAIL